MSPRQRRIYSVEELAEAFERTGLRLTDVFDEQERRHARSRARRFGTRAKASHGVCRGNGVGNSMPPRNA